MIEMNNNLIKSGMDYQKMIEDGKQTAPKLDEIYKIKNHKTNKKSPINIISILSNRDFF
jgi:hypothetical protein